jgi:hypothetical protein
VGHGQAMLFGFLSRDLRRIWRVSLPVFALRCCCFDSALSGDSVTKDAPSNDYMCQDGRLFLHEGHCNI